MTHTQDVSLSQVVAAHLLAQLNFCGVEHVFVAPGSRSQALAIAAKQLADAAMLTLTVRVDERSLAFQALGAARATNKPVAIITTSGTAVANLMPAVLEAFHTSTPLILITADRPHALRETGANQTTLQQSIFGDFVIECQDIDALEDFTHPEFAAEMGRQLAVRAVATSLGHERKHGGPVQLNISFAEPLSSAQPNAAEITDLNRPIQVTKLEAVVETIDLSMNTIVIAGDQANDPSDFDVTGIPVFAEPSSSLLLDRSRILHYRDMLAGRTPNGAQGTPDMSQLQQLVILGKPTLSREVQKLIRAEGLKVYSIPGRHKNFKPTPDTIEVDALQRLGVPSESWYQNLKLADGHAENQFPTRVTEDLTRVNPERIAPTIADQLSGDYLVLGASTVIRDFDLAGNYHACNVLANRGLAGIDGTIGFATGVALSEPGTFVTAVIGDLTALHDVGSLAYLPSEPEINLCLIVVNNSGGRIFDRLEVKQQISDNAFEQLFQTPQQVDFESLAKAFGWNYRKVTIADQLWDSVVTDGGRWLVEIVVD